MLAWYFHKHETLIRFRDFLAAGVLLVVPVGLIAKAARSRKPRCWSSRPAST